MFSSLLDHLTDDEPRQRTEGRLTSQEQARNIIESIVNDISHFLNTRKQMNVDFTRYPELKQSIINYGLLDASAIRRTFSRDEGLADEIADAIIAFEPRVRDVEVEATEDGDRRFFTISLAIDGMESPISLQFNYLQ